MPDPNPPTSPPAATGPRKFLHDLCKAPTEMPADQVRGRLENPHGYNDWVYCRKCDGYVARRECRWADTGENLAEFFDRAKAAAPPPGSRIAAVAPAALAALGGVVGYVVDGGRGASWGVASGLVLGVLILAARALGLR